jgi:hypothetical protein
MYEMSTNTAGDAIGAVRLREATEGSFGTAFVTVADADADAGPVSIWLSPPSTVSGSVVVEGDGAGRGSARMTLMAVPADFDRAPISAPSPRASVSPDGSFLFSGVTGPVRFVLSSAPAGWWLESVQVNGVNGADDPVAFDGVSLPRTGIRVVVSTRGAAVAGRLADAGRQPSDYTVVVFSTDSTRWWDRSPYVAAVRSDQDGAFNIPGLPPGGYWAVAVDAAIGSDDWRNPDVLFRLAASARRITLDEGQRMDVELHLAPTP